MVGKKIRDRGRRSHVFAYACFCLTNFLRQTVWLEATSSHLFASQARFNSSLEGRSLRGEQDRHCYCILLLALRGRGSYAGDMQKFLF